MNKIIENKFEYYTALDEIESLMDQNPEPDSTDGKKLHLLALLIKNYEKDLEILQLPDPIEALKFRMDQQELQPRDLISFIGSRSKVSEVLTRKRPLSIEMIRALNDGLGIPARVLIQESPQEIDDNNLDWDKFPIKEIILRKWIDDSLGSLKNHSDKIIQKFLNQLNPVPQFSAFYRSNHNFRSGRTMDMYSLYLWNVRILIKAKSIETKVEYNKEFLTKTEFTELVKLSILPDGPIKAIDYLSNFGIKVVIEPHLPRTYLDGAAIISDNGTPVIGLTLRYDRIDNFWFTLLHELAHIYLHNNENIDVFYDDLEAIDINNKMEVEADEFAREALVPRKVWEKSPASKLKSPQAAEYLAKELQIHPAIVAGKMRFEFNAYRLLNNLIGNKQVRKLFKDISWS